MEVVSFSEFLYNVVNGFMNIIRVPFFRVDIAGTIINVNIMGLVIAFVVISFIYAVLLPNR